MKKITVLLICSFLAVSVLFGATAVVAKNISLNKIDEELSTSSLYEIVEFIEPDKTEYYLSDVQTVPVTANKDEKRFIQKIDFDGTGMSITVRNVKTGEEKKYDYTCNYFELDGKTVIEEDNITFRFDPGMNVKLTVGQYTADVVLVTDDGESVVHKMPFTIVEDPVETQAPTEKETVKETQPPTEAPTLEPTQEVVQSEDSTPTKPSQNNKPSDIKPQNQEEMPTEAPESSDDSPVLPDITRTWNHMNNPKGVSLSINSQSGNTLNMTITCIKPNDSQIVTADISVTLDDIWQDGNVVRGSGSFSYTDSFSNIGIGEISVSDNVIILSITEESNAGLGFGISYASGKYI